MYLCCQLDAISKTKQESRKASEEVAKQKYLKQFLQCLHQVDNVQSGGQ